jgi:hypothetical protein
VVVALEVGSLLGVVVEALQGRPMVVPLVLGPFEAAVDILEEDRNLVVTVGSLEEGPFLEVVHIAIEDKVAAATYLVVVVGNLMVDSLNFVKDMVAEEHILVEAADILVVVHSLKFVRDMVTVEHSLVEEADRIQVEGHNQVIKVDTVGDIVEEPMDIHLGHCTVLECCRHLKLVGGELVGYDELSFQLQQSL